MVDTLTPERRSENMRRIRSKDTNPEIIVRQLVRELGHSGYRLHRKDIAGKPDLAWVGRRIAIFVHGCFWHGHISCSEGLRRPKSNRRYWNPKIAGNAERDQRHLRTLKAAGWRVLTIWECEIKKPEKLTRKLGKFLASALVNR